MASPKEVEAGSEAPAIPAEDGEDLPAYSAVPPKVPTVEAPFNFPDWKSPVAHDPAPTALASSSTASTSAPPPSSLRPVAFPQVYPNKTAPFLDAYAPVLLQYGIPSESWRAFLTTMSAFLTATISRQALAHAADVGRHLGKMPINTGTNIIDMVKGVGRNVQDSAAHGNVIGAAMGVVAGAMGVTISAAVQTAGILASLPGTAIGAVVRKPKTPRQRAEAYAKTANAEWLVRRGLQAQLVDTAELAAMLGVPAERMLIPAPDTGDRSAAGRIRALSQYIGDLEVFEEKTVEFGRETLWLVVREGDKDEQSNNIRK